MSKPEKPDYVTITHGMRGYFAVNLTWNKGEDCGGGFYEPEQSGIGSYASSADPELIIEAQDWADDLEVEFRR